MSDKPELTLYKTKPIDVLPKESFDNFKQWILQNGLKPSVAIHQFMEAYDCPDIHVTTFIELLEFTYPDIDLGSRGLRFKILDSAYPNSDPSQFSDNDLDESIKELLANS